MASIVMAWARIKCSEMIFHGHGKSAGSLAMTFTHGYVDQDIYRVIYKKLEAC